MTKEPEIIAEIVPQTVGQRGEKLLTWTSQIQSSSATDLEATFGVPQR
jgi:hypothetical protein